MCMHCRFINRSVNGNLTPRIDDTEPARPRLLLCTSRTISQHQELLMSC